MRLPFVIRTWHLVVLFVLVLFLMVSLQPTYELQQQAPEAFLEATRNSHWSETWGRAYWERALVVQWKYHYGRALPDQPPPEFQLDELVPNSLGPAVRDVHWQRLRVLWLNPDIWDKSYSLDFRWIPDLIDRFASYVVRHIKWQ